MLERCAEELQWAKLQWGLNNYTERQGNLHKSETGQSLGIPNSTVRSGDLDDEKGGEGDNLCI